MYSIPPGAIARLVMDYYLLGKRPDGPAGVDEAAKESDGNEAE